MMKSEKGFSLITLIITIIVIMILASTTIYVGMDTYNETVYTTFVKQMQFIQRKVDTLAGDENIEIGTTIADSGKKEQLEEVIANAVAGSEISNWDISSQNIRYFSKEDIQNALDIEEIDYNIIVNFDTREVVSEEGIEREGKKYYTQYNLPQGQKISQYDDEGIRNSREEATIFDDIIITRLDVVAENITIDNADGLNCTAVITNIGITNGTLQYKLNNDNWKTIDNNTKKGKDYAVQISKSGTYVFKLTDNTTASEYEISKYIEVINSPKKNVGLNISTLPEEYDYSNLEDSSNYAYYYESGIVRYLWVPRFAYKGNEIKFTRGTSNLATDGIYLDEDWQIPETFKDEVGNKLTGKWIAVSSTLGNNLLDLIK